MRILITNDDGIDSVGINVLAETFCKDNEIFMVAPDSERSAFSHSLTIFKELHVHKIEKKHGITAYSTSGTPADCVKFALIHLLKDNPPDLLISGINNGPNLGSDIMYSGTVAGATEGAYLKIPSIAISLNYWNKEESYYAEAAQFLKRNLSQVLMFQPGADTVLNVNYPCTVPYKGVKATKTGINLYSDVFTQLQNTSAYKLSGLPSEHNLNEDDCDVEWSKKGYVTITPLKFDRTDYDVLKRMKNKADFK